MDSLASSFIQNCSGQLLSRVLSFGINMYLLRRIDSDALGLVNVNLVLFCSTTIFLVREPFRKVFLADEIPLSVVTTHVWLAPLICPLIAAMLYLCFWLPFSTVPDASLVPSYTAALSMFAFSAWLESFAEPYVILSLRFGLDGQYAFAQGFLVITQRVFVVILIITIPILPVHAFCFAQILSSFCYTVLCIYLLVSDIQSDKPSVIGCSVMSLYPSFPSAFSKESCSMLGAFTIHSIFKQIITNGTGYVLTFTNFFSLSEQAVFDAVDRLGSLVARIVFAPLEHSAYLYFSANLRRTTSAKDLIVTDVKKGIDAMKSLLHIVIIVGSVIFIFAIPYSPLAITIYGGTMLVSNSGVNILRLYCFYILVIAVNGITECFAMATMNEKELLAHGWFLLLNSPIQIILSFVLSYAVGAYGLIIPNIISMVMRTAYSWKHIYRFSNGQICFLEVFPNFRTVLIFLFCLMITSISLLIFGETDSMMHSAAHVAIGCSLFIFLVNYIYQNDLHVAKFLRGMLLGTHVD